MILNAALPKIENATNKALWDMWRSGCPAPEAIKRYCSPELRDRHAKALAHDASENRAADVFRLFCSQNPGQNIANSAAIKSYIQVRDQREYASLYELEKQLYEEADKRELIPVAFSVPRSPNDNPFEVPPDILSSYVGWSVVPEFRVNGMALAGLRFASADLRNAGIGEARGPGRWSRRDQIKTAISDLYSQGQISLMEKRAPQIPKIRKRVMELFPADERGEKGLGADVIDQELKQFIIRQQAR